MNKKKAILNYKPNTFEIIKEGDHVVCAISKKEISLEDLKDDVVNVIKKYL